MHDDVGAVLERPTQIGRRQRVVDDERHAGAPRDRGDGRDVDDDAAGIGDGLDEDRLGLRRHRLLEAGESSGSAHTTFQLKLLKEWLNWLIEPP